MKKIIISLVMLTFLFVGCVSTNEYKPDPNDPAQQAIVVSVVRLGTAAYLDKNGSSKSVARVISLGKLLNKVDDEYFLSLTAVEVKNALLEEFIDTEEVSLMELESIRLLLDTVILAVVQWKGKELTDVVDGEFLLMLALAGKSIEEVANLYVKDI